MYRKRTKAILIIMVILVTQLFGNISILAEELMYGDIDGNRVVNASDALVALKHAAKIETIDNIVAGDVDGSGKIDATDALLILKYAAKIIKTFPVQDTIASDTPMPTEVIKPVETPTVKPEDTSRPVETPTITPTDTPRPTVTPTIKPTDTPKPTEEPTIKPTDTPKPTEAPTIKPTDIPLPTATPAPEGMVVCKNIDFETNDGFYPRTSVNGSKIEEVIIDKEGHKSLVITMGKECTSTTSKRSGAIILNPFINHSELKQSLVDGLKRADAALEGKLDNIISYDDLTQQYSISALPVEDVIYPRPTYSNGLSISAWVRMPEGATESTPIFCFYRNTEDEGSGAINIQANGVIGFTAGTQIGDIRNDRNAVLYDFPADELSILQQAGKWVYMTVTIQNNQIRLYYNGKQIDLILDPQYTGTVGKMFNKGFGPVGFDDPNLVEDRRNNYTDLLNKFKNEEIAEFLKAGTTRGADVSRFSYINSSLEFITDFIMDPDTYIYIGGVDSNCKMWFKTGGELKATYVDAADGMQIDDVTLLGYSDCFNPDQLAKDAYDNSVLHE